MSFDNRAENINCGGVSCKNSQFTWLGHLLLALRKLSQKCLQLRVCRSFYWSQFGCQPSSIIPRILHHCEKKQKLILKVVNSIISGVMDIKAPILPLSKDEFRAFATYSWIIINFHVVIYSIYYDSNYNTKSPLLYTSASLHIKFNIFAEICDNLIFFNSKDMILRFGDGYELVFFNYELIIHEENNKCFHTCCWYSFQPHSDKIKRFLFYFEQDTSYLCII